MLPCKFTERVWSSLSRWRSICAKHCAGERFQSLRLKTDQKIQSLEKVLLGKERLSASTWCTTTQPHWVLKAVKIWALLVEHVHAQNALHSKTLFFFFLWRLEAVQPLICPLSSPFTSFLNGIINEGCRVWAESRREGVRDKRQNRVSCYFLSAVFMQA